MIAVVLVLLTSSSSSANAAIPIVDTLGAATPATQFSVFGSSGISINDFQVVGPEFILTQRTTLIEIGGFVNGFTLPATVQIRPSANGGPDASTVLASFILSSDNDPLIHSYESVAINLTLEAGTYFALFAPQGNDAGGLLNTAQDPFNYMAELTTMGFLDPFTGISSASNQFGAVRILGIPTPPVISVTIDIKPGRYRNSINPKSNGVIPVAILTTDNFDATTVDHLSVEFGPSGATEAHGKGYIADADGDGDLDLVLHFKTQETGIQCGDTEASLTGETFAEQMIEGTDSVHAVACK